MTDPAPRNSPDIPGGSPPLEGGRWALIRGLVWVFALLGLVSVAALVAFVLATARGLVAFDGYADDAEPLILVEREVVASAPPPVPSAPRLDDRGRSIVDPAWIVRPQIQYPDQAARQGVEGGEAVIECEVTTEGRISSCAVVSEAPTDAGFGEAAVAGALKARLHPPQIDGEAYETRIRYTARFRLE